MAAPHPITRALLSTMMHSRHPMVLTDPALPDGPMIAVNPAFLALSGYPAAETVGRNCRFLQGPETCRDSTDRLRRCIAERRGCIEWVVNYRKDGSRFWNLLFIAPIFAPDGTLLHFFGNQRDLSTDEGKELPGHMLGGAEMSPAAQAEFNALLHEVLATSADGSADQIDHLIQAGRRLNDVAIRLKPFERISR